ncbi:MAG: AAA family ATPase [Clostridiales bacterium]|nr:AAA family ATPase [Clostridiales bacterium]
MIMGESGSGKSCSLRNFEPSEVGIFNVAGKPLPFKKKLPKIDGSNYKHILKALDNPSLKTYVIDDSQYLMAFAMFDRAKETGYGKFTDVALDFRNLIQAIITKTPPDVIVYFLHHTEITDVGKVKAKTSGKMLDNQLTLEGLFSIVLLCQTDGTNHKFITQSDGFTTAKSPMGLFEPEIDNDLKMVDQKIREYYELNKGEKNETD